MKSETLVYRRNRTDRETGTAVPLSFDTQKSIGIMSPSWRLRNRGIGHGVAFDDGATFILLSFLGGVASSSFLWWYFGHRSISANGTSPGRVVELDPDDPRRAFFLSRRSMTMDDIKDSLEELKCRLGELPSALDELKNRLSDLPSSLDGIRNRIGELPGLSRRRRWPWDRSRAKSKKPEVETPIRSGDGIQPPELITRDKSDLCIGSIFGLDVGGTLGKLVYFEQKSAVNTLNESTGTPHHRERTYRAAASAKTVLMARADHRREKASLFPSTSFSSTTPEPSSAERVRSGGLSKRHSRRSSEDLANLNRLRQESVPDDLHAYAETLHLKQNKSEEATEYCEEDRDQQTESTPIRKSRSMLDFSRNRAEALDHFYNFARRLDSYREGVKDDKLSFYSRDLQGEFHFIHFETRRMPQAMDLIRTNKLHMNIREMGATGGGAHKFANLWEEELGIVMKKQGELDSLVAGMQFVLTTVVGECYSFRPRKASSTEAPPSSTANGSLKSFSSEDDMVSRDELSDSDSNYMNPPLNDTHEKQEGGECDDKDSAGEPSISGDSDRGSGDDWWWSRKVRRDAISYSSTYPYLVVTIGTGVSILRVDGPQKFERVSGSTIGGGTYWGLIRLLTDVEDFDDVLKLAARGDPSKVDMMVSWSLLLTFCIGKIPSSLKRLTIVRCGIDRLVIYMVRTAKR